VCVAKSGSGSGEDWLLECDDRQELKVGRQSSSVSVIRRGNECFQDCSVHVEAMTRFKSQQMTSAQRSHSDDVIDWLATLTRI
jgi:hypothetical protein